MPAKATLILIPVVTLTPPTPTPTRSLFVIAPLSPPSHVSRHAPRTSPSLIHARDRGSNGRVLALSRPDDDDSHTRRVVTRSDTPPTTARTVLSQYLDGRERPTRDDDDEFTVTTTNATVFDGDVEDLAPFTNLAVVVPPCREHPNRRRHRQLVQEREFEKKNPTRLGGTTPWVEARRRCRWEDTTTTTTKDARAAKSKQVLKVDDNLRQALVGLGW